MNQVFTSLPDNRPVTAIVVVENPEKCPKGFQLVGRTHDQDSDADLWRESGFFGKRVSRYLCLSKTEGAADRVVEAVMVISEKQAPPEGYTVPAQTYDTSQKAWRKKRLCYKMGHAASSVSAVTDVIVLSRSKKPPEEFSLSGEINGLTLCHKIGKVNNQSPLVIPYSVRPPMPMPVSPVSPSVPDYMNTPISPLPQVVRRPPPPLPVSSTSTYATISGFGGLEGVPFTFNPKFSFSDSSESRRLSMVHTKSSSDIDREFSYEFRAERAT